MTSPWNRDQLLSSKSDDWTTPPDFMKKLEEEFGLNYDPCPLDAEDKTVLLKPWKGRVFCNPPYSNIAPFLEKAIIELGGGNIEIAVFLLPSRTGTRWFHDLVLPYAEVRFLRGRLKFGSKTNKKGNAATFDTILAIFRRGAARE